MKQIHHVAKRKKPHPPPRARRSSRPTASPNKEDRRSSDGRVQRSVDTNWFLDQIKATVGSQRKLGIAIGLDHVLVYRLITGKRKFSFEDVAAFSRALGVSQDEILIHAGIRSAHELDSDGAGGPDTIAITGWVDGDLRIHWEAPKTMRKAPSVSGANGTIQVVRFQTEGTRLDALNGALAYFKPQRTVTIEAIGKQCVVKLVGDVSEYGSVICILKKSYQPGAYRLTTLSGEVLMDPAIVESASPVLWLKFQ